MNENKIKMLLINPMRLFRELIKGTYFNRNRSLRLAYFYLVGNAILVTALVGIVIFLYVGLICLAIYFLLLWVGLGAIADKVILFPWIAATVGGLTSCMGYGAEMGIRMYKEHLELPFDEIEEILDNLSIEKGCELRNKINNYICKTANELKREIEKREGDVRKS